MKKSILMMAVMMLSLSLSAQIIHWTNPVADETRIDVLKSSIKVSTANQTIYDSVFVRFGHFIKRQDKRTVKEKYHIYQEIVMYFNHKDACDVIVYLKYLGSKPKSSPQIQKFK